MDEEIQTSLSKILSQLEELEDNIEKNVGGWQEELLNIRIELRNLSGEPISE